MSYIRPKQYSQKLRYDKDKSLTGYIFVRKDISTLNEITITYYTTNYIFTESGGVEFEDVVFRTERTNSIDQAITSSSISAYGLFIL